jgi:PilZ domain
MPSVKVPIRKERSGDSAAEVKISKPPQVDVPSIQLPRPWESRSHIRVLTDVLVNVKYRGIYEALGQAINLSARGIFFALDTDLAPGSEIEVVFRLPPTIVGRGAIWLRCRAKVVRVEKGWQPGRFRVAAQLKDYDVLRAS